MSLTRVDLTLSKNNATGFTPWTYTYGVQILSLHTHVNSVGATPTATIVVEFCNLTEGSTSVEGIFSTAVAGTGDTYKTSSIDPYKYVRINCTANTNVNFEANLIGAIT